MFRALLPEIQGIAPFQVLSLMIFFAVFMVALVVVFRMKKSHVEAMRHLPLDLDESVTQQGDSSHG